MIPYSREIEEALLELRQQHGQLFYLRLVVAGTEYEAVFRPLVLKETNALSLVGSAIPPFELNDWISCKCILHLAPRYLVGDICTYLTRRAPAALSDILADCIIKTSGFEDPNNYIALLQQARQETQTMQANLEIFICSAFPGTKPKDIEAMNIYEQMNMLARAEAILGKQLDITPAGTRASSKGQKRRLSPEAAAILSKEAADIPDPERDVAVMDQYINAYDRMDMDPPKRR